MTKKHFEAILAKNEIAKMIAENEGTGNLGEIKVNTKLLHFYLRDIEIYIGEGNQPSILDIIHSKI